MCAEHACKKSPHTKNVKRPAEHVSRNEEKSRVDTLVR